MKYLFIFLITIGLLPFPGYADDAKTIEIGTGMLVQALRNAVIKKAKPKILNLNDYEMIERAIQAETEIRSMAFYGDQIEEYVKQDARCSNKQCAPDEKLKSFIKSLPNTLIKEILPKYLEKDGGIMAKLTLQAYASLPWLRPTKKTAPKTCIWDIFSAFVSEERKELFIKAENCIKTAEQNNQSGQPCEKETQAEDNYIQKQLKKLEPKCGKIH